MALVSRKCMATAFIVLVLSTHPINAARVNEGDIVVSQLGHASSLTQELQRSLQEDISLQHGNETEGYIGEWFASCAQRKKDVERRLGKLRQRYETAKASGFSIVDTTRMILKARSVSKTWTTAEKSGCQWVTSGEVDTSELQQLASETAVQTRCFNASKKVLEGGGPNAQDVLGRAVKTFLSEDCEATETSEGGFGELMATATMAEKEADEALDEVVEKVLSLEGAKLEGAALIEQNTTASDRAHLRDGRDLLKMFGLLVLILTIVLCPEVLVATLVQISFTLLGLVVFLLPFIILGLVCVIFLAPLKALEFALGNEESARFSVFETCTEHFPPMEVMARAFQ